jgi:hypothetical protein
VDAPAAFVDHPVVPGAEHDEVVWVGRSVEEPEGDVVGLASGDIDAAAGEAAVVVA